MVSRFSGALRITDLDDFINPSQECIKPVKSITKSITKTKIQNEHHVAVREKDNSKQLQKVDITLADCLACSGCITSAESVLVTQQSQDELLRVFQEKKQQLAEGKIPKYIVVSLSVQPVLSLAERYGLEPEDTAKRISSYFTQLGADSVLDMTLADDIALLESAKEFVERYKSSQEQNESNKFLPMLSSSCPGWICYAEKTHGNFILPYLSVTKSPQQIMGTLVKYFYYKTRNLSPETIYHLTLMPCYDKKLEASRQDFYNELKNTRDVDCVITPIEMEQMLMQEGLSLRDVPPMDIQKPFGTSQPAKYNIWSHGGSGSGGYADYIYRYASKHLFQESGDVKLELKTLRNPDFQEGVLEKEGKVLLRFAVANGFRNIQNLVQKLKRNKCTYHYVEVMACPSGCLNGGAQIRPQDDSSQRDLINKLERVYHELPKSDPEENKSLIEFYKVWLEDESSKKINTFLHTQYHEIKKLDTALAIKW